jgi:beta-glucosidase
VVARAGRRYPGDFLWGAATAGHQVEGDNTASDWWEWENRPDTPCREPSGRACEHYTRYADDVALLAAVGLNTYRFSVEWSRVEPADGEFDDAQLDHYRRMVDVVRAAGVEPMVTLNHFTVPAWFGGRGGWTAPDAADRFGRYCERVVSRLGATVDWWCTLNEPGNVAVGGYLGVFGWPPGTQDLRSCEAATAGLVAAHRRAVEVVKSHRAEARVGATHGMQEWTSNRAGAAPMRRARRMFEDVFLEAASGDDYLGIQTYTRVPVVLPALLGPFARVVADVGPARARWWPGMMRAAFTRLAPAGSDGIRRTEMGYEFRPEAIAATVRRAAAMHPGKDLVVTEHGIATHDDAERVEYLHRGLAAVADLVAEGLPVRGYLHWSLLDNFEWVHGYRPTFGLIGVDRETMQRTVRPSAEYLGAIARAGALLDPPQAAR